VASRLDQLQLSEKEHSAAIADERVRVARDLHDVLLQSLTGAALQLEVIQREAGENEVLRSRLRSIQEVIETDQRELRSFIANLRPDAGGRPDTSLRARLSSISQRFHEQWGIAVEVMIDASGSAIPERLASEIFSIVSEAVANAAKHAGAQWVSVAISANETMVRVTVQDDGRGFPFLGSFTLADLDHERRGPVTLKQRVVSLLGNLRLESTPGGSRIEIELPV
jgi:signal transduction histidine kinase